MDLHLGFANVRDPWELGQVHVTERVLFSGCVGGFCVVWMNPRVPPRPRGTLPLKNNKEIKDTL